MVAAVFLSACDTAFVDFPANDLLFDVPIVDPTSIRASCSDDGSLFTAQFNATGRSPETLATVRTAEVERHTATVRRSEDADFGVHYRLGPLQTGTDPELVVSGESTSLRCDDLSETSVSLGILDGFGVAVECVQWVGLNATYPDLEQEELMDVGCITVDF